MKKMIYLCCVVLLSVACKSVEKTEKVEKAGNDKESAWSVKLAQSGVKPGYGSPKVKQELVDGQRFLIKEISTDKTYGYTEDNPIMVGGGGSEGIKNTKRFFEALTGPLGLPVMYKRLGSCCTFYSKNGLPSGDGISRGLLDIYEVIHDSLEEPVKLYVNMYDSDVLKVPVGGFILKK